QHSHRTQSRPRDPRPGSQVGSPTDDGQKEGGRFVRPPCFICSNYHLFFRRNVSWHPLHSLPMAGTVAFSESRSLIFALASVTTLAKPSILAAKPALSSQIFGEEL